jgi:hypothetical protein
MVVFWQKDLKVFTQKTSLSFLLPYSLGILSVQRVFLCPSGKYFSKKCLFLRMELVFFIIRGVFL